MNRGYRLIACLTAVALMSCTASASDSTPEGFVEWMRSHRQSVGLAAFEIGAERSGMYVNADELFPLASTRKVLILSAYALKVASGTLNPAERVPASDLERWYWAGTDGGAHKNAVDEWRQRRALDASGRLLLDMVVRAMIRWSDNAASDYVLERVGGPDAADALARRIGMTRQEPMVGLLGEFLGSTTVDWASLSPAARSARARELARATSHESRPRFDPDDVATLVRTTPRGTPREWARLMSTIFARSGLPREAAKVMQRHLEWPLAAFSANRNRFERYGTKGGSLPGVITEATYVQPKDKRPMVVVLFLRDVPRDDWTSMFRSFVHQQFMLRYAEDPAFRTKVRDQLSG